MSDSDDTVALRHCAEDALQYWDLDLRDLRFVVASENAVFRVSAGDGAEFALRIHRQGYHSLAELESENEWTTALNAAGISTPRPVQTRMGSAYATVPFGTAGNTRQVGLTQWIDGIPLSSTVAAGGAQSLTLYCDLGAVMARIHEQAIVWTPSPGFVRHALDAEGLVGDAPWWGPFWDVPEMDDAGKALVQAARHRMYRALVDYGKDRGTYSLIHADLLPQNVLVCNGRPYVIDFDDAGYGWHQYDMAVALVTVSERADFVDYRDALVRGYRSVRPIADEDLALLPMFIAIRGLAMVGWFHSRISVELVRPSGERLSRSEVLEPNIRRAVRRCEEFLDSSPSVAPREPM